MNDISPNSHHDNAAISVPPRKSNHAELLSRPDAQVARLKCSFAWRFQIHGLWANADRVLRDYLFLVQSTSHIPCASYGRPNEVGAFVMVVKKLGIVGG